MRYWGQDHMERESDLRDSIPKKVKKSIAYIIQHKIGKDWIDLWVGDDVIQTKFELKLMKYYTKNKMRIVKRIEKDIILKT